MSLLISTNMYVGYSMGGLTEINFISLCTISFSYSSYMSLLYVLAYSLLSVEYSSLLWSIIFPRILGTPRCFSPILSQAYLQNSSRLITCCIQNSSYLQSQIKLLAFDLFFFFLVSSVVINRYLWDYLWFSSHFRMTLRRINIVFLRLAERIYTK